MLIKNSLFVFLFAVFEYFCHFIYIKYMPHPLFTEEEKKFFNDDTNEMLNTKKLYHLSQVSFHQNQISTIDALLSVGTEKRTVTVQSKISELNGHNKEKKNKWAKPAFQIISEKNCFLKTDEIYELLKGAVENEVEERRDNIAAISQALIKMIKRGKIKSHSVKGVKGKYYGLPSMFDGEEPKREYLQVIENKKEQFQLETTP